MMHTTPEHLRTDIGLYTKDGVLTLSVAGVGPADSSTAAFMLTAMGLGRAGAELEVRFSNKGVYDTACMTLAPEFETLTFTYGEVDTTHAENI